MAKPKSANLTAAPFALLANNKFSGCKDRKQDSDETQAKVKSGASCSKHCKPNEVVKVI